MSSKGSDKEFYKLVKDQGKTSDAPYSSYVLKERSPDDICDGRSTHFGSLATPLEMDQFDNGAKITYLEDNKHILHICRDSNMVIDLVSTREIQTALKKLKSNKAAE